MGGGKWTDGDWARYSTTGTSSRLKADGSAKSTSEIFTKRGMDPDLDPMGVSMRESRDSEDNPESNAIIVGLDVTGSMGMIADKIAREGLNVLLQEIYDRKPVTDPHVMINAIGDVEVGDRAPLQVTQFEADIRLAEQLDKIYLEHGGGGNRYESYALPWYFAALHTSIDCFEKRGKKGYLFTVGDELPTPYLKAKDIEKVLGTAPQTDLDAEDLLTMVQRQYEVFHITVAEGYNARSNPDGIRNAWNEVLGQRAIWLEDYTKLAETIVSAIQINEGAAASDVAASWDGDTSLVIAKAFEGGDLAKTTADNGIVNL